MKVLHIDYQYYLYPNGINNFEDLLDYLNQNRDQFIPLTKLLVDNCVEPYFIESETANCCINLKLVDKIQEKEATILSKEEYEKRLQECMKKTCLDCVDYIDDPSGDNLLGHRDKLRLDGHCDYKTLRDAE